VTIALYKFTFTITITKGNLNERKQEERLEAWWLAAMDIEKQVLWSQKTGRGQEDTPTFLIEGALQIQIQTVHRLHPSDQRHDSYSHYMYMYV